MNIGLELEYWVVDGEGKLAGAGELIDANDYLINEFVDSLVEVRIPPFETVSEVEAAVGDVLESVLEVADDLDRRLVPLGTPLTEQKPPIVTDRGRLLDRIYDDDLRYAKNCAGTHVHFDRGETVRQLNLLTALDPALALVSSSPYYGGRQIAASSRALAYRHQSNAALERYRGLWGYVDSVGEWERRIAEAHDLFAEFAAGRGVEREAFEAHFRPENTVLTPVRLRDTPETVEWRAPDTALPSQVLQLVGDVAPLVELADSRPVVAGTPGIEPDEVGIPSFLELRGISSAAVVDGLESSRVGSYLSTMGFDPSGYDPITKRVAGSGEITDAEARSIRLEYASLLESDVEAIQEDARASGDLPDQ